jgi:hypothetical protein
MGNAAWGAGLAALMDGRSGDAAAWLGLAAGRYVESYAEAPAGSWGRPVAVVKCGVIAGDAAGAAHWALGTGCADDRSPIARYAACLALLVLGRDAEASAQAAALAASDGFPRPVAEALSALARQDAPAYEAAALAVLSSFGQRDDFLEGIRVADTVVVLQRLARERGLAAELASPLLPP